MPEREPMNPDLAAALRAYEVEMRDGTERSQRMAFETLRLVQRRLGGAAVIASNGKEPASKEVSEPGETQLAS